ncbi:MAG: FAD-dependent oxidoreductase [Chloroflexota bacterium]
MAIAGGGVAGAEALLALRHLLGDRVEIELISGDRRLVHRPLAVAEPFGLGEGRTVNLDGLAEEQGASFIEDVLAEVDPERRVAVMQSGIELRYDALLLAIGARGVEQLPGALTYDGGPLANSAYRELLDELERGAVRRIAFAAPTGLRWSLPLYELALLTAHHAREHGLDGVELALASEEERPLEMFGERAGEALAALLAQAGIGFHGSQAPVAVKEDGLGLADGSSIAADRVVALPRLEVAPIPGVPQGPSGFIGTDLQMRVEGLDAVYAAGDATWFPLKQGGIAAQQADVAAAAIASTVVPSIPAEQFRPVLRGALLTGAAPLYLRSGVGEDSAADPAAGAAPLWWPPAKVAARHLAPYLGGSGEDATLDDVPPLQDEELDESAADHREAVELALAGADADARWQDYAGALRWLDLAEQLNLTLPPEYAEKRRRWIAAGS